MRNNLLDEILENVYRYLETPHQELDQCDIEYMVVEYIVSVFEIYVHILDASGISIDDVYVDPFYSSNDVKVIVSYLYPNGECESQIDLHYEHSLSSLDHFVCEFFPNDKVRKLKIENILSSDV